ncbi:MAG: hypothetical protein RMY62_024620 [Nostoc sp. ZfuVER08]|uniref:Uncharacterized protein n=1 Tax=Nostoc punctiforme FACHB-252 TaxID=1357509 RepID=A0ABR8HKY9_NOSPU|nr:hypothetical protein [Nostoc punctiforme]MBD2616178.1 hypothetical protein [Nostoc punctiforme FACHB-252]MBL1198308.1 hypothetical protein [Nostoc sp. GBBB01]MDZ8010865.1 hypothetical protein [Nostoc sp. ZfuVER08]
MSRFRKIIPVFSLVTIGFLSVQIPVQAEVQTLITTDKSSCSAISHQKIQKTGNSFTNSLYSRQIQSNANNPEEKTQEIRFPIKQIWWCVKCQSGIRRSVKAYTEVDAGFKACGVQSFSVRRGKCPEQ